MSKTISVNVNHRRKQIPEVKCTVVRETADKVAQCRTPGDVHAIWSRNIAAADWFEEEQECFVVLMLNTKNMLKGIRRVSIGLLDASLVHPREVFRTAIAFGSAAIIACHNHPSGDSTPSSEDIRITKQLVEAGRIIDIKLLDHVVIGNEACSLRENGLCDFS